jgi:hypothetical protein
MGQGRGCISWDVESFFHVLLQCRTESSVRTRTSIATSFLSKVHNLAF